MLHYEELTDSEEANILYKTVRKRSLLLLL